MHVTLKPWRAPKNFSETVEVTYDECIVFFFLEEHTPGRSECSKECTHVSETTLGQCPWCDT